jgi:hypothetical protein
MSVSLALTCLAGSPAAAISVSVKAPDGTVVGEIDLDETADGKGVEGGFTSTYGAVPSLDAAAAKCGVDHFNWFQTAYYSMTDETFLDPPFGGSPSIWADDLYTYWDEGAKPEPEPANWQDGYLLTDHLLDLNTDSSDEYLHFLDYPSSVEPTFLFMATHLAGVRADGSIQSFFGGCFWTYTYPPMFENVGTEDRTRNIDPPPETGKVDMVVASSPFGGYRDYCKFGEMLPGDTNLDGFVDEVDAQALAQHWGETDLTYETVSWATGDFNFDGSVGMYDAAILAANWTGSPSEATTAPEPGVLMLVVTAACALALQRRR